MQGYEVLKTVGEGTYGIVLQCRDKLRHRVVAVKRFKHFNANAYVRRTMARELRAQKVLRGEPYVVHLLEAFQEDGTLHLVMEYIEHTLLDVLDHHPMGLSGDTVQRLLFTLLIGVRSCHRCGILHRDIKPENILVCEDEGTATLCDFGFSRPKLNFKPRTHTASSASSGFSREDTRSSSALSLEGESLENDNGCMTDYVATRWYRSPEMLLGFSHYSFPVDMWAVGAIMAEACDGQPLLPGKTELEQITLIQNRIGPLPPSYVAALDMRMGTKGYPTSGMIAEKEAFDPWFLENRFTPYIGPDGVDLMRRLLTIDSKERITVEEALEHPFFEGLSTSYDPLGDVMETSVMPVHSHHAAMGGDSGRQVYEVQCPPKELSSLVDCQPGHATPPPPFEEEEPHMLGHLRSVEEAGLLELSLTTSITDDELSSKSPASAPNTSPITEQQHGVEAVRQGVPPQETTVPDTHLHEEPHSSSKPPAPVSKCTPKLSSATNAPERRALAAKSSSPKVPTLLFRSRRSMSPMSTLSFAMERDNSTEAHNNSTRTPTTDGTRPTPPLRRMHTVSQQARVSLGSSFSSGSLCFKGVGRSPVCGEAEEMLSTSRLSSNAQGQATVPANHVKPNQGGYHNEDVAGPSPGSGASPGASAPSQKRLSTFKGGPASSDNGLSIVCDVGTRLSTDMINSPIQPNSSTTLQRDIEAQGPKGSPLSNFMPRRNSTSLLNPSGRLLGPESHAGFSMANANTGVSGGNNYLRLSHDSSPSNFSPKGLGSSDPTNWFSATQAPHLTAGGKKKSRLVLRE